MAGGDVARKCSLPRRSRNSYHISLFISYYLSIYSFVARCIWTLISLTTDIQRPMDVLGWRR